MPHNPAGDDVYPSYPRAPHALRETVPPAHVTAVLETSCPRRKTVPTVTPFLESVTSDLDALYGEGYARKNPALVGALVQASVAYRAVEAASGLRPGTVQAYTLRLLANTDVKAFEGALAAVAFELGKVAK
jgi:hypothetical protein